ncbi:MAG: helix-turn-helix domain-containing protein [Trueperaceae bacterium]
MYNPVKDGIEKTVRSVRYIEVKPPSHLSEFVHCFWELKTDTPLPDDFRFHILPDACVNILFNQLDTNIAAITALHTAPKVLNLGKTFHYVGIQLLPGVWRGDPDEIANGFVDKPYGGNAPLIKTNRELAMLNSSAKGIVLAKLVEQLILDKFVAANMVTTKILTNLDAIYSVADMAEITSMSPRQLQRTLKQTTGFSPHDFLKVLRVQQSFKQNYLDYYADQSHFIHSFRKITGYTPLNYTKRFDV